MQSFTAMSDEGIQAVIDAQEARNDQYALTLGRSDFYLFVRALQAAYEHTADGGCPAVEEASYNGVTVDEWAGDFLSGIAETLGVEFI